MPYPGWAEFFGWLLAIASMIMVPTFALIQFYHSRGTTLTEVSVLYAFCSVNGTNAWFVPNTYIVLHIFKEEGWNTIFMYSLLVSSLQGEHSVSSMSGEFQAH